MTPSSSPPYQAEITIFGEDDGTGQVIFTATVTSGTVANILGFNGEIQRYSDPNCNTQSGVECPFSANLNPGDTTASSVQLCSSAGIASLKVVLVYVNGIPIFSSPQDIVAGGNTYRIVGFNVCGGL